MTLNPYLTFDGRCREAFEFYADALGGRITSMFPFGDTPAAEHMPTGWGDKIMHAHLSVGDRDLMGSDAPPGRYEKPQGFSVSLQFTKVDESERVFAALSEGGNVIMPLQQTFWAARFGMLVDRFGIPWMINCENPS